MARNPRLMTTETRLAAMQAADAARRAAVKVCAEAPIGSAQYRAAARTLEALSDLAKALAQTKITPTPQPVESAEDEATRSGLH